MHNNTLGFKNLYQSMILCYYFRGLILYLRKVHIAKNLTMYGGLQVAAHLKEFLTDRRILFLLSVLTFYCISTLFSTDLNGSWVAALLEIIWFYLVEYIVHRFFLHGYFANMMPKAYKGHDMHHQNPNDIEYLLTPNIYNISYHIGFGATVYLVTQDYSYCLCIHVRDNGLSAILRMESFCYPSLDQTVYPLGKMDQEVSLIASFQKL